MHDTMPHDASLHVYMRLSITYSRGRTLTCACLIDASNLVALRQIPARSDLNPHRLGHHFVQAHLQPPPDRRLGLLARPEVAWDMPCQQQPIRQ